MREAERNNDNNEQSARTEPEPCENINLWSEF